MDSKVIELLKSLPKEKLAELTKEASKASSKADIVDIASKVGVSVSDEQADAVLKAFSENVAVEGDDLDNVSGGCNTSEC